MQLLAELNRLGTTVVVATHNDALVERHPARAMVLEHGRLVEDGEIAFEPSATPAGFDDLGLKRVLGDRMLPLLVAAMAFLAALAGAGAMAAASLAGHWREGAGSALTVQVPHPGAAAAASRAVEETRIGGSWDCSRNAGHRGNARAAREELNELLRPWLGRGAERPRCPSRRGRVRMAEDGLDEPGWPTWRPGCRRRPPAPRWRRTVLGAAAVAAGPQPASLRLGGAGWWRPSRRR